MPRREDRSRSRSPRRHQHRDQGQHTRTRSPNRNQDETKQQCALPFNARHLTKHELPEYRPMFALFLDIQKHHDIEDMDEEEVKGRWKSFVKKWNRGELAEGWYAPATLEKAIEAEHVPRREGNPVTHKRLQQDESDSDYGPALPSTALEVSRSGNYTTGLSGPTIPSVSELQARHEQISEEANQERQNRVDDIRIERRQDRKLQKERLDELVPRADVGTRERQLEKKREKADVNREFAAAKDGGGDAELRDSDIMGDEDSLGELKRMKREAERKKNEREIRKEEFLRARRAERETRMAGLRAKEDKTMEMLKEIAKARFGDGEAS